MVVATGSVVALVSVPSFAGVPWIGIATWAGLVCTILACVAISYWVAAVTDEWDIPGAGGYRPLFAALPAVAGGLLLWAGPWALPIIWALLVLPLLAFVRQRDAVVPDSRVLLSRHAIRNIRGEVGEHLREWRGDRGGPAPSLKEQVVQLVGRVKGSLTTASGSTKGGKGAKRKATKGKRVGKKPAAAAVGRDAFTLYRKDGNVLMSLPLDGGDKANVSANVRNTQKLLTGAIRGSVTDMVFDPGPKQYLIRVGVGGGLKDADKVPVDAARGVIATIRVVAGMKPGEPGGRGEFSVSVGDVRCEVQAASTSEADGEKLVLTIARATESLFHADLGGLGMRPKPLEQIRDMARKPHGLLLVVGPRGGGRTTTAYAVLRTLDAKAMKITTIEEEVESRLEGITQIAVETSGGASIAGVLKMVLRQDPDVIYLADVPDRTTAELACQAALTGHLVIAAMEARDALGAIGDLLETGLEPMLVQTSLTGVVAQRLARRLCPKCRVAIDPPDALLRKCNLQPGAIDRIFRQREGGCQACGGTGFRGRLAIHEVLAVNEQVRRLIARPLPAREVKAAAILNGMMTMQVDGLTKVLAGETAVEEILAVTS
jgi:type II secretory ATPase GspE/PulE/Tfp pilus assembly ATPase PilB-like protein